MKHISYTLIILVIFTMMGGSSAIAADIAEVLVFRPEGMPWCGTVDGKDVGLTVDILQEVTKHGGPKFRFESVPWTRAQAYAQKKTGTTVIPLTRTPEREKQYTWIIKLVPNQARLTLVKNPKNNLSFPSPLTLENLKPYPVGIIRGSAFISTLEKLGFTHVEVVSIYEQNVKMLTAGRIAAVAEAKWVDIYNWKKFGGKIEDLIIGPEFGDPSYIYLGAGLDFPSGLTRQIRDAMSKVEQSGALETVREKWANF